MANAADTDGADPKKLNITADWLSARTPLAASNPKRRQVLRIIKIALPVIAAGLLGVIFARPELFNTNGHQVSLTFSGAPQLANEELRMTRPRFTGTDSHNRTYSVTADMATQSLEDHEQIALSALEAEIDTGGSWLSVRAVSGEIHTRRQQMRLSGTIDAYSDLGYEFHGTEARIDLASGAMQSDQPVQAQGALGQLRADSMRADDHGQKIYFSGNVRVVIYPRPGRNGATGDAS